jgi:hypothetical protein
VIRSAEKEGRRRWRNYDLGGEGFGTGYGSLKGKFLG